MRREETGSYLFALEFPAVEDLELFERACRLAVTLNQHLCDTLYHAVALHQPGTMLVTTDDRYYWKGAGLRRLTRLREFALERP